MKREFTTAEREKAKAALKAGAKKRRITKLLKSIKTIDLSPIDEEIAALKTKIAELEALRQQALALRGQQAPPTRTTTAAMSEGTPDWIKIREYLKINPGAKPAIMAADLSLESTRVNSLLQKHQGDVFERRGYGEWYVKNGQEVEA